MVYLLHFDKPYKGVQHYIGYADDLEARIEKHRAGNGSKLMAAVTDAGIEFGVAKVWPEGDRSLERQLKNYKKARRFCPVCNPNYQGKWKSET
jgi:predicted GIY-YIG superfamily endonuclease